MKKPDYTQPLTKLPRQTTDLTAEVFISVMESFQSDRELEKIQRYFKSEEGQYGEGDVFMGIRMGQLFEIAKAFVDMPVSELEKMLESPVHEIKTGALSIMDKKAREKKTSESQRKELFDLYLRRHDRINNWDLVDIAAVYVIGRYLIDKPRDILYKLAVSDNMWERRTAMVSTGYFIKEGQVDDTFSIGKILINDKEDLIHKAVGGWIRHAGGSGHAERLLDFLDQHAASMPRTALRYATEHLGPEKRKYYLDLKTKDI